MALTLTLIAPDLDNDELQMETHQLCHDLRSETEMEVAPAKEAAQPGTMGGEIEIIGQILIKAIGAGGAIVALLNVLKAYVERKPKFQFEFQAKDGEKIKVTADDLSSNGMERVAVILERLAKKMK